jgi:hypothetical protein
MSRDDKRYAGLLLRKDFDRGAESPLRDVVAAGSGPPSSKPL